jgi:hypothetical protein
VHVAPPIYEMALYHGASGALVAGEFVENRGSTYRRLGAEQLARRRAMIACYASQQATLAPFVGLVHERYRFAPRYDFARSPHEGPLWYERLGFAMSGARWRAIAACA